MTKRRKTKEPAKAKKPAIVYLVVNLRCLWCKNLFPWRPARLANIEGRIRETCSERCKAALRHWELDREYVRKITEGLKQNVA